MRIVIYKNLSSDNTINKILVDALNFDVFLRSDFNPINGDIILRSSEDLRSRNYLIIEDLNRKYFINSITVIGLNLYRISLQVDLLETFKDEILNSKCEYLRPLKSGDYLNSDIEADVRNVFQRFDSDLTLPETNSLIMVSVGA